MLVTKTVVLTMKVSGGSYKAGPPASGRGER